MKHPDNLRNIQNDFLNAIDGHLLCSNIEPAGTLTKEGVIEVYQNDYRYRLTDALGDRFESVWAVIGDEAFFNIAWQFIQRHPSTFKNLSHYGQQFASYLANHPISEDYSFLSELALFELQFWNTFHSKKERFDSEIDLNKIDILNCRFQMTSNSKLIRSNFLLYDMFSKRKVGFQESAQQFIGEQFILLFKNSDQVGVQLLTKTQFLILDKMQLGQPLSLILDSIEDIQPNDLKDLFTHLAQNGLINSNG